MEIYLIKNDMKLKIKFKVGSFVNCFKITPCIQITYPPIWNNNLGIGIELTWGKWGIGWRFYIEK